MIRASQTWAVARYELIWDLRKKRTYFIAGLSLFAAFTFGYLVPMAARGSITSTPFNPGMSGLWWVNVVEVVFNTLTSGLFPLLIGGIIAADSLASEFDKNTIVPLLTQPITRLELYGGKFLEKILVLLFVTILFTLVVLVASEASVGAQTQLYAFPLVVFFEFGAILQYAALAFLVGVIARSGSMVLGILIGLFFVVTGIVFLLGHQFGFQETMLLLPVANPNFLLNVIPYSVVQPSGNMVLQGTLMGAWTPPVSVTVVSAIEYVVIGLAMNLVAALAAGYYFFKKAEVKK